MWFSATPFEICFSTSMFYSIFFISKCRCDDIPRGAVWNKNGSFQIYVNKIPPWKSARLSDEEKNHLALKAWLLSTVSVGIIACFCCICWNYYRKGLSRSQSSNVSVGPPRIAEIVPSRIAGVAPPRIAGVIPPRIAGAGVIPPATRTVLAFQINHNVSSGMRSPSIETGNIFSRGVVNFSFSSGMRDPVPPLQLNDLSSISHRELDDCPPVSAPELDDHPPAYSVVVSDNFNYGRATALHPQIPQTKKVETPPPDYSTINPFDNSSRATSNAVELYI